MPPTRTCFNHIVAFEVSKAQLVVHTLPADCQQGIDNTPAAVRRLLKAELRANARLGLGPMLVVCEATGGYERYVLEAAQVLGLAIHRAHGSRTRLFARFNGKLAKTDAIDARLIARYGLTPDLPLYTPPSPQQAALRQLRQRRDEIGQMLRMEINRTEQASLKRLKTSLLRHKAWLEDELKAIEAEIATLIENSAELRRKADLMQSLKGIGPLTAAAILAYLPEIGTLSKAGVAALCGLAPIANDSGQHNGKRHIAGGRATLRTSLYMAAIVARRYNPRLKAFAEQLRQRGKPNKLIITAIMRKLIVILNAIVASRQPART
ncbi:MAG TPA: IS110 family transposase [Thioalkalivibrio sp.]|nr:IS110 family transposase [Thioalkalivibrio sp.]